MKTILITGANGLLGSLATKFFENKGMKVITAGRQRNDIYMDFNNPMEIANTVIDYKIDSCIHLAAANEVNCFEFPYESINVNVTGTKAILDFCVRNKIKHIIYISTMHVYGNLIGKIDENIIPTPNNDYGMSHYFAEKYVEMYGNKDMISYNILRPTNLYDVPIDITTHKRWSLVPYQFCKDAIINKEINIRTNGTQRRNFLSIEDLNCVILNLIKGQKCNEILHVYGKDDLEIKELAQIICQVSEEILGEKIHCTININDQKKYEEFTFNSLYLKNIYLPKKSISDFIKDFIREYREKMES